MQVHTSDSIDEWWYHLVAAVIGNKPSKLQRCFNFKVGQHFTKSFTASGNAAVTAIGTSTIT